MLPIISFFFSHFFPFFFWRVYLKFQSLKELIYFCPYLDITQKSLQNKQPPQQNKVEDFFYIAPVL